MAFQPVAGCSLCWKCSRVRSRHLVQDHTAGERADEPPGIVLEERTFLRQVEAAKGVLGYPYKYGMPFRK
jgi:hypothetical protein